MNNIKRLFQILGEWKWFYVLSGILLIFAMFIRMLESKILQITVDKVIVFYQTGGKVEQVPDDSFTVFLYSILPEFKIESPEVILISLGILFLVISVFSSENSQILMYTMLFGVALYLIVMVRYLAAKINDEVKN